MRRKVSFNETCDIFREYLDNEAAVPVTPKKVSWRTTSSVSAPPQKYVDPDWAKLKSLHWQELKEKKIGSFLSSAVKEKSLLEMDALELDFTTKTPVASCSELNIKPQDIPL